MEYQKSNFRNKLTRESIFTALSQLMGKEDYSIISITQITKKAGVSRMAYYRNYDCKEKIITDYFDYKFNKYLNKEVSSKGVNVNKFLFHCFIFFRNNELLIKNMMKANLKDVIREKFSQYLKLIYQDKDNNLLPNVSNYSICYITGGLFEVLIAWINNEMLESDEKISEIVCNFME